MICTDVHPRVHSLSHNTLNHFGSSLFSYKPSAAIVSYSAGQWGGTRAALALRAPLSELGCLPVSAMVHIPRAHEVLGADGVLLTTSSTSSSGSDEGHDGDGDVKGGSAQWTSYAARTWSQLEWWGAAAAEHRAVADPFEESAVFASSPSQRDAPSNTRVNRQPKPSSSDTSTQQTRAHSPAPFTQPTLAGTNLYIRPIASNDFEPLFSLQDPLLWAGHPSSTRYERPEFENWFNAALDANALVVVDNRTGMLIGSSRYYLLDEAKKEVCIGYTWLARAYWGGETNAEVKQLMLAHAFNEEEEEEGTPDIDTVWFHIAPSNVRSQRATERIGAKLSHSCQVDSLGEQTQMCFYLTKSQWQNH